MRYCPSVLSLAGIYPWSSFGRQMGSGRNAKNPCDRPCLARWQHEGCSRPPREEGHAGRCRAGHVQPGSVVSTRGLVSYHLLDGDDFKYGLVKHDMKELFTMLRSPHER